jgi:hypothetical protein
MKTLAMMLFLGIIPAAGFASEDGGFANIRSQPGPQYSRDYGSRYTPYAWSAKPRPAPGTARPTHGLIYKQGGPYYVGFFGEYYGGAPPGDPSMDIPEGVTKTDIANERTTPADVNRDLRGR